MDPCYLKLTYFNRESKSDFNGNLICHWIFNWRQNYCTLERHWECQFWPVLQSSLCIRKEISNYEKRMAHMWICQQGHNHKTVDVAINLRLSLPWFYNRHFGQLFCTFLRNLLFTFLTRCFVKLAHPIKTKNNFFI